MYILFIIPLHEPYYNLINIDTSNVNVKTQNNSKVKKLYNVYPIGVLSIASVVKKHYPNIDIKILDLNVHLNELLKSNTDVTQYTYDMFLTSAFNTLHDIQFNVIGISALFTSIYSDIPILANFIKYKYTSSLLICGGGLPTTSYKKMYDDNINIDALFFGESEESVAELIYAYLTNTLNDFLEKSPSVITKSNYNTKIPKNTFIHTLDHIPPYNLDLLVYPNAYFNSSTNYLFLTDKTLNEEREILLHFTRGCPFNCNFCASHKIHGKKVRRYSIERVIEDIKLYKEKYNITTFSFQDDHFFIHKNAAVEIMSFINDNGYKIKIINPAFFSIDEDIVKLFKKCNINTVYLSIESGDEHIFKNVIKKPSSIKKAMEVVDIFHKYDITVGTNILFGFPEETPESIEAAIQFLSTTNFDWFNTYIVSPLPGSRLYDQCISEKYLVNNTKTLDYKKCLITTNNFSPEFIETKTFEANLRLNYIHNYNMRIGNYSRALMLFENVINNVTKTNPLAYYYASICYGKLNNIYKKTEYISIANNIISTNDKWNSLLNKLNINIY